MRVLIAEDSATQAERLRAALESRDFSVTRARDGEEALRLFLSGSFELVISDVIMPKMTGYELCRAIKSNKAERDIPVILLTSLNEPMEILRGLECGADNFLTKPYQTADLFARIDRILDNRRLRAGQVSAGVDIMFMDNRFTITSDKEQILDLLISTFEDMVRANLELQRSRSELSAATAKIRQYAAELEERVQERTVALVLANNDLQAEMLARRQAQEQLIRAQKMESIGNLTGGMAHDFNNLLGIVIANIDLLRELKGEDADVDELTQEALDAAIRGAELTRRLLAFARQQPLQPRRVDVNELVGGITKLLGRTVGEDVEISLDLANDVWPTVVDPTQLESSLVNLANNARDAMPSGGRLFIKTANSHLDCDYADLHTDMVPGDYAEIQVHDSGTGMSAEVMARIFEPFYTTKEQGKGTGLGLSMVFGFMKQSGGHVNVYSELGLGTTFRLYLPRLIQEDVSTSENISVEEALGGTESILMVEDNAGLRRVAVRQLMGLGYRVIGAEDAHSALEMLEREDVDLMLTDIVMPGGIDGIQLAKQASDRRPSLKILFTSGFAAPQVYGAAWALPDNTQLLPKPYRRDQLAKALRTVLDS